MENLDAYIDGQLDEVTAARISNRLESSPELKLRVENTRTLGNLVRSASQPEPSQELKEKVEHLVKRQAVFPPKKVSRRRGATILSVAAVLSLVLIYLAGFFSPPQAALYVADHIKMTRLERHHDRSLIVKELERDLSTQLEFWPALPRWSWAKLVSGSPCKIGSRPVARVCYRFREDDITVFIMPSDASSPLPAEAYRGFRLVHWEREGLRYVAVVPASASGAIEKIRTSPT